MAFVPVSGVSDGELIRTQWGDDVANDISNELLRRDGTLAMNTSARLTLGNVDPTADNHAVRKKYVDDNYVNQTGDTMTGALNINPTSTSQGLILRSQVTSAGSPVNTPTIGFYNNTQTFRLAYITGAAGGMSYGVEDAADKHSFIINSVNVAEILPGGHLTTDGELRPAGGLETTGLVKTGSLEAGNIDVGRVVAQPGFDQCVSMRAASPYIDFQSAAGTRYGYIQGVFGGMTLVCDDGEIRFSANAVEGMRLQGTVLLVGKTATSLATGGVELLGATGQIYSTADTNVPNIIVNRQGTADVDGGVFASFRHNNTQVGSIQYDTGTSHVVYVQTSDYRLKNDLGPVVDGLERIRLLNPRRITRKDSAAPVEHDALIAHEVAEVMPEVVTGVKDAVAPPPPEGEPPENYPPAGAIIPQTLDYLGLTTVTIAAIKDLADKVDALTARLDALEAA